MISVSKLRLQFATYKYLISNKFTIKYFGIVADRFIKQINVGNSNDVPMKFLNVNTM